MKAALEHSHHFGGNYSHHGNTLSLSALWQKITAYANSQEERRFFWAAISILGHGTIFTIGTLATVILTGNVFGLLVATCFSMVMVLVVNLAALPLRYIIPVFLLSLLVDLVVIITALTLWFN
jgi:CBS domain containing-hemolysin-like protein